jgi:drug/metabolite transporter (DMT)-like permease
MGDVRGYLLVIGAAALWGISATVAKLLLNRDVDTILIVQWRVTFSSLLLLAYFLPFKSEILRVRINDLWQFALAGILGVAGANFTYYFAIRESTVATAILIQYTAPLAVLAYAAVSRTEVLSPVKIGAACLSLLGCFLAVGAYDPSVIRITPVGLLSACGSMLTFAFLNIYTRHLLSKYTLWTTTFYSFLFASVFWLVVNPPWAIAASDPSAELWLALFILAIISVLIPHTMFFAGLRHLAASRAMITSTFEPIVAIVSAALVLQELLQPLQTLGAVLVLTAIVLLQVQREPVASPVTPTQSQ